MGEGCRRLRSQGHRTVFEDPPSPPLFQKQAIQGLQGPSLVRQAKKWRPHRLRDLPLNVGSPLAEKGFPGSPLHPPRAGGSGPLQEVAWAGTGLML